MASVEEFIRLYKRDAESVLLFFTRRTLDAELGLDLMAETFAQAWRGWSRVRTDSPEEVRAWLFTIARRQLSRALRRGRVERDALRRLGLSVPLLGADEIAEIERAAGIAELRSELVGGLSELSEEQREAVRLRVVEEPSYAEVAMRLGVNEAAARARVSRGLRALATNLEAQQSEAARQ